MRTWWGVVAAERISVLEEGTEQKYCITMSRILADPDLCAFVFGGFRVVGVSSLRCVYVHVCTNIHTHAQM